jgi:hypothetical protein
MTRVRLLVWLVTLVALIAPPGLAAHASATPSGEAAAVDCPDHAPPPAPCPDEGTARHAASTCCPLMMSAVALLAPAPVLVGSLTAAMPAARQARSLAGRTLATDPPPPRL